MMALIIIDNAEIDQAVKQLMLTWLNPGEAVPIIGDWFRFYLLFNRGAAFSMVGEGSTWLFTTIQLLFFIGAAIAAPMVNDRWEAVGLAMLAGGALDRN